MWYDPYVPWLIHMWYDPFTWGMIPVIPAMTQLCICSSLMHVCRDLFMWDKTHSYETWLMHTWHDVFICDMTHAYMTWLMCMCHDSNSCDSCLCICSSLVQMCRDWFICDMTDLYETWLKHIWRDSCIRDMTHSYVPWLKYLWFLFVHLQKLQADADWLPPCICETWLIHMCHDSFACLLLISHHHVSVRHDSCMCAMTHLYVCCWLVTTMYLWDMTHAYVLWLICMSAAD